MANELEPWLKRTVEGLLGVDITTSQPLGQQVPPRHVQQPRRQKTKADPSNVAKRPPKRLAQDIELADDRMREHLAKSMDPIHGSLVNQTPKKGKKNRNNKNDSSRPANQEEPRLSREQSAYDADALDVNSPTIRSRAVHPAIEWRRRLTDPKLMRDAFIAAEILKPKFDED